MPHILTAPTVVGSHYVKAAVVHCHFDTQPVATGMFDAVGNHLSQHRGERLVRLIIKSSRQVLDWPVQRYA